MGDMIKKIFGKESILAIIQRLIVVIPVFFAAILFIVNNVNNHFENITEKINSIDQKVNTQNVYFLQTFINDLNKQYWKIKNDPSDIKPMDIETIIDLYHEMNGPFKTQIITQKMEEIIAYKMNQM